MLPVSNLETETIMAGNNLQVYKRNGKFSYRETETSEEATAHLRTSVVANHAGAVQLDQWSVGSSFTVKYRRTKLLVIVREMIPRGDTRYTARPGTSVHARKKGGTQT